MISQPNTQCPMKIIKKISSSKKRRIYDVTNVLEGAGMIEKVDGRRVRWKSQEVANAVMGAQYDRARIDKQALDMEHEALCRELNIYQNENFAIESLLGRSASLNSEFTLVLTDSDHITQGIQKDQSRFLNVDGDGDCVVLHNGDVIDRRNLT